MTLENKPLVLEKRRQFLLKDRLAIICHVQRLMHDEEMTRHGACEEVNVHPTMYLRWMRRFDEMSQQRNPKAKSSCPGRPSCLEACKDDLLRFIFERREQGMAVSVTMVMRRAEQILPPFAVRSRCGQYHSALRFVHSQGLVFRLGTNESQRSPAETATEALKVVDQPGRHQDFIINMDQTPVLFTYNSRKTLDVVGKRTVHVRKSIDDTKRATFAMTVTASGKILKPLIVFKGARNGRTVQREFPN